MILIFVILSFLAIAIASDDGPLILTPLIRNGQLQEARQASLVRDLPNAPRQLESYSGFLTVNDTLDSNLYFWFFVNENRDAPILLYLEGGPGVPSIGTLLGTNGPFDVNENGSELSTREFAWTNKYSIIYVDNPIGTGFSFTNGDEGYSKSSQDYIDNLMEAMRQFFVLFDEFSDNEFYIGGTSYSGKYTPLLAYAIHSRPQFVNCNLTGIFIGGPWSHPESLISSAIFLRQTGLIDEIEEEYFGKEQSKAIGAIRRNDYQEAYEHFANLILLPNNHFFNVSGLQQQYNYLRISDPEAWGYYVKYLERDDVSRALHVGNQKFQSLFCKVFGFLEQDIPKSVFRELQVIVNNYRVLLYSGQVDIIVPAPLVSDMINQMTNWTDLEEYKATPRRLWRLDGEEAEVAGWTRSVNDFHYVVVRNAGHVTDFDQPRATFEMMDNFLSRRY